MKNFKSNGKLLISGEYVVLDGAIALAIPTKQGQSLKIETIEEPEIIWRSLNEKGNIWFEDSFSINNIISSKAFNNEISNRLIQILMGAKKLNPQFLSEHVGYKVTTFLDFPKHWGLGTSSTLVNNIAQWAKINPYTLLENTFGGSGYDIACAQNNTPITYQKNNNAPIINTIDFNPNFKNQLYFIYLNKKQNSHEGIAHYKANRGSVNDAITDINNITSSMVSCNSLEEFDTLIVKHERIISQVTRQNPVKNLLFSDFKGQMKSLGAWGGDFILATSQDNPISYFNKKGFDTVIPYTDMIL